jgi:putative transposase
MTRDVESNNNVTFDCKYHVIFCPKYHRKVLTNPVEDRLKTLLIEKAETLKKVVQWPLGHVSFEHALKVPIVELGVMPDHVHILVKCEPQFGIHKDVKHLKGYTYIEDQKAR